MRPGRGGGKGALRLSGRAVGHDPTPAAFCLNSGKSSLSSSSSFRAAAVPAGVRLDTEELKVLFGILEIFLNVVPSLPRLRAQKIHTSELCRICKNQRLGQLRKQRTCYLRCEATAHCQLLLDRIRMLVLCLAFEMFLARYMLRVSYPIDDLSMTRATTMH